MWLAVPTPGYPLERGLGQLWDGGWVDILQPSRIQTSPSEASRSGDWTPLGIKTGNEMPRI